MVKKHTELTVYQKSFDASMVLFQISQGFPKEETYSLTDQVRRSSRSVSANLAEAWRKRRYEAAFIAKLTDCEAEAAETQVWIQYSVECAYLDRETATNLYKEYDEILSMIVAMILEPKKWLLTK